MSIPVSVRIIHPDAFDAATAQTAGSQRLAAVTRSSGIATGLWGGLFSMVPGARIDVHHHGAQETIAFVLEGVSHLRWGQHGEFSGIARAGDFLHIPPWLPHMETNRSIDTPVRWVVVRSTPEPIVVNLPANHWDDPDGADPDLPARGVAMKRCAPAVMLALVVIAATSAAWADGDGVTAGRDLFASRCAACHGLNPTRKPGPPLAGVYGRRAGTVPNYHYSAALKGAPVTWNEATLDRWLRGPPAFIPGVNMQAQVDSEQDRQNLIAYLKSLGTAAAAQNTASFRR